MVYRKQKIDHVSTWSKKVVYREQKIDHVSTWSKKVVYHEQKINHDETWSLFVKSREWQPGSTNFPRTPQHLIDR